ncbi:outer membrane transport energization protein TonB (TC 2.C.1.1.1) [Geoalkalibacter ferrihydriticus]|uniref:Protein TonB n=1 Tax=Geoalkalibacter ferrihydriticus TaxID=392333 RepID=A0A1G9U759_9BACT|nr:energy transducer TonB [Geoalkalibacter ferrihydriticus]SDM55693.1 outer membrane transport energization protein TonB (TC 2.C.1.1.1) [Geoalkalibacter ferrihydriticus]
MTAQLRYLASLGMASGVALGLFWLMTSLISVDGTEFDRARQQPLMNFIRMDDTPRPVEQRRRERPKPPEELKPAPQMPAVPTPQSPSPQAPQVDVPLPQFRPDLALSGVPTAAPAGPSAPTAPVAYSQPLTPVSQVPPVYPRRALMQGLSGWVRLNFVINADGSVGEIEVVEASPRRGVFDHEAVRALSRWRFKPQTVEGQPVPAYASITINFNLEN